MTITQRDKDRLIALAALVQSVALVQQIAESGQYDPVQSEPLLHSLLTLDAPSTEAVYGQVSTLKPGLIQLNHLLSKRKNKKDIILLRYLITLMHLERQLAKRPAMIEAIRHEIIQLPKQTQYFGTVTDPHVIARMADIYHHTISTLTPRIHVIGNPLFLQQSHHINQIRALLLAGIRAAVLWRQKGGRRWHFILQSSKLLTINTEFIQSL